MSATASSFAERLRELRRRHFGARGKTEFARRLELTDDEYDKFERGHLPPGELIVRICEVTGEDLQWLLTGVASRGTVVISGARGRHQTLLTDIAALLDARPELSSPIEAFVDLLQRGPTPGAPRTPRGPLPPPRQLIPLLAPPAACRLALALCASRDAALAPRGPANDALALLRPSDAADLSVKRPARLLPLRSADPSEFATAAAIVDVRDARGDDVQFLDQADVAEAFPSVFGVWLPQPDMAPMFSAGDAALVAPDFPARVGRPALCGIAKREDIRCRIWLGADESGRVQLGRLDDGARESLAAGELCWSLEILYRLTPAA